MHPSNAEQLMTFAESFANGFVFQNEPILRGYEVTNGDLRSN
jgi:hypothetical protein